MDVLVGTSEDRPIGEHGENKLYDNKSKQTQRKKEPEV